MGNAMHAVMTHTFRSKQAQLYKWACFKAASSFTGLCSEGTAISNAGSSPLVVPGSSFLRALAGSVLSLQCFSS